MNLYIQIKDGAPFEHPMSEANFVHVFPDVDINNLPSNFAKFERVQAPPVSVYQVYEGSTYEWVGDVIKDVHHVRDMTDEEKIALQEHTKKSWAINPGWISWVFDEASCRFNPPISRPQDGNLYIWNESLQNWELAT